jgi:hypothetical protein
VATTLVAQHSHTPPSAYAFAQSIRQIIAAQCSKSWCCLSIAGWLTLVVSACIRLNPRTHMHCFVHCRFTAAQCSTVFAPASGWADARCSAVRTRFNRHAHALLIHRRFTTPCYTALRCCLERRWLAMRVSAFTSLPSAHHACSPAEIAQCSKSWCRLEQAGTTPVAHSAASGLNPRTCIAQSTVGVFTYSVQQ